MDDSGTASSVPFGTEMRKTHFLFARGYRPLNHGSFGAVPKSVLNYQRQLQLESEQRPDAWIRYTYLELLKANRSAIAPLLGADPGEVVFVPNATTGINTVLRNIPFAENEFILYFSSIYGACSKTIQSLPESCPVASHQINITYPITDEELFRRFRSAIQEVNAAGKRPKLVMFDTVLTFPGVRFPWEAFVNVCRDNGILNFVDAAHGIGHIDLTHAGRISPDFMVSNCYKWLMVPRGCAVLYVPSRNQRMIVSTIPTSWGYLEKAEREASSPQEYFDKLFNKVSTIDNTPYCCITAAIRFRLEVCGGEAKIREYCFNLAKEGAKRMAEILETEELRTEPSCCFATVRLPLSYAELGTDCNGRALAKWMQELTPAEYDTYIPIKFYNAEFWCRISAQIYLTLEDFEWAAMTILKICQRAKTCEWNNELPKLA